MLLFVCCSPLVCLPNSDLSSFSHSDFSCSLSLVENFLLVSPMYVILHCSLLSLYTLLKLFLSVVSVLLLFIWISNGKLFLIPVFMSYCLSIFMNLLVFIVSENDKLVSLNVTNMFGKIPKDQLFKILENNDFNNQPNKHNYINIDTETINWNYCRYNDKYYAQTTDLAMSSPLSPIFAEIYMNDFENYIEEQYQTMERICWRRTNTMEKNRQTTRPTT